MDALTFIEKNNQTYGHLVFPEHLSLTNNRYHHFRIEDESNDDGVTKKDREIRRKLDMCKKGE